MHLGDTNIDQIHTTGPHLFPSGPQFFTEVGVVLFEFKWATSKQSNHCIH